MKKIITILVLAGLLSASTVWAQIFVPFFNINIREHSVGGDGAFTFHVSQINPDSPESFPLDDFTIDTVDGLGEYTLGGAIFNPTTYRISQEVIPPWQSSTIVCTSSNPEVTTEQIENGILIHAQEEGSIDCDVTNMMSQAGGSSVLFLPGLEASRLYKQKSILGISTEDQLWEPNVSDDVKDLYLNSNGISLIPNIYTKDIIGKTNILGPLFSQDIYKSLTRELDNLVSTGRIQKWKAYAYDWRQGINDIIENGTQYDNSQIVSLVTTLQSLAETSKTGKVTILTHSNGGLLAKALIKKLEEMKSSGQNYLIDHIDNLIMVAVPQIGTPDGMSATLHGYKQSLPFNLMTETQARILARNMSSAYGLIPSKKYFEQSGVKNPAVFDLTSTQLFKTAYSGAIDNYQKEHNFVLGSEGRTEPNVTDLISPIKGNSKLLTEAENLHESIDNMIFPSSIKITNIAGWGKETIAGMNYTKNDIQPIYTFRGDKTVVAESALYGDGTKYWLDLSNSKLNHANILENPQLLDFIKNIIENKSLIPSNISNTEPSQIHNRLQLSVHSPVTIGIYDKDGNFTGKVCDESDNCITQENIPGSTYFELGEGKYVNTGEGNLQKALLQGIDTGTFTFDSKVVTPNGKTTVSSFTDIPVTTQTQAEINLNQNTGFPELALDVTGDGVRDFTLTPDSNFNPITYLKIMKTTIDSLDIAQAKIKSFDSRIDSIIKAIQKGKVDKAKLKVDKFRAVLEKKSSKPDQKHKKVKKLLNSDAQLLLDMLNNLLDNLS